MAADPLDDLLRNRLSGFSDPGDPAAWPELAQRLDEAMNPDLSALDPALEEKLKDYQAPGPVLGWDRISSELDQADRAFDETLRRRVAAFEVANEEGAWGRLLGYWQDSRYFRTRLVMIKGIEAMALVLLLLTTLRFGWFETAHPSIKLASDSRPDMAMNRPDSKLLSHISDPEIMFSAPASPGIPDSRSDVITGPVQPGQAPVSTSTEFPGWSLPPGAQDPGVDPTASENEALRSAGPGRPNPAGPTGSDDSLQDLLDPAVAAQDPGPQPGHQDIMYNPTQGLPLSRPETRLALLEDSGILKLSADPRKLEGPSQGQPGFTHARNRPEISAYLMTDVSALRMPEERIFSIGQQVVFPEKRMISQGYGGGFTIATGHPHYAVEIGIQYSARTFRPGRRVTLGDAFDNSTVDFQALRLQLVSIPIQARYRLDRKGSIRTYAAAGMTFTVVAQSDLDVVASYNFNSLAPGEDPNTDPVLARTIRETRRISEHLRDGEPFSSKNYVSLQGGFGLEYILHPSRKLFVQALAQYQIPNLQFSNHNGKDLRAVVIQAGLRSSLGY